MLGAIKYNKTSGNMSNAYGLSIFFPYKRTSKVNSAVATYSAIGMDSEYARCIQQFANLEVGGQSASNASGNPLGSLFGNMSGGTSSSGDISDLLGGLLGGGSFFGREIDLDNATQTISANQFDGTSLVWTLENGRKVMRLSEAQWSQVHDLQCNVFFDDGEGYLDLGLDNVYDFTDDGALIGEYDGTWIAIDGQPVAYYYNDSVWEGEHYTISGRVPVLLNGERAELQLIFDNEHPDGYIVGAQSVYVNGETQTVPKSMTELQEGDTLDFIYDYYSYDEEYQNSYMLGEQMTYHDGMKISNVYIDKDAARATYLFTDIYNQEYWSAPME